jgi:cholesterol transport system auxiliary component
MRNNISTVAIFLTVIASLVMGGCTNLKHAPLEIHYYTLAYDPPRPVKTGPLPHIVKIEQFQTSPLYDSNRMIYKNEDYTRDEYTYHKWRALPGELVAYFLVRDFSETGRFQAALYYESNLSYTCLITGVVEDFYLQAGKPSAAILSVAVNLVDTTRRDGSNRILMQKKYRLGIETQKGGPQGLAEAMSIAMQRISEDILMDVAERLEK